MRWRDGAATAIRLEGFGPSVEYRRGQFRDAVRRFRRASSSLEREPSLALLGGGARRQAFRLRQPERLVWRISVPPAGARRRGRYRVEAPAQAVFRLGRRADLAGRRPPVERAGQQAIRAASLGGGHATLIRAPDTRRRLGRVFEPQPAALAALSARVKESLRPEARPQSRPHVRRGLTRRTDADQFHPRPARRSRYRGSPKRSCAPASIAASAPPPARPTCCSATSSTARAAAST